MFLLKNFHGRHIYDKYDKKNGHNKNILQKFFKQYKKVTKNIVNRMFVWAFFEKFSWLEGSHEKFNRIFPLRISELKWWNSRNHDRYFVISIKFTFFTDQSYNTQYTPFQTKEETSRFILVKLVKISIGHECVTSSFFFLTKRWVY